MVLWHELGVKQAGGYLRNFHMSFRRFLLAHRLHRSAANKIAPVLILEVHSNLVRNRANVRFTEINLFVRIRSERPLTALSYRTAGKAYSSVRAQSRPLTISKKPTKITELAEEFRGRIREAYLDTWGCSHHWVEVHPEDAGL